MVTQTGSSDFRPPSLSSLPSLQTDALKPVTIVQHLFAQLQSQRLLEFLQGGHELALIAGSTGQPDLQRQAKSCIALVIKT
jgi:hypothetical protein